MSDLHNKDAFYKKAREMAEGLSKEQLIEYYMGELETCCEVEERLIEAEKALAYFKEKAREELKSETTK